ncbi:hypothetical protein JYU20_04725, partial [Bacteroidales bacterium AH-315-I05]|nr:hypothetical protein [Bacteroidales bacterium AH-315-I05]
MRTRLFLAATLVLVGMSGNAQNKQLSPAKWGTDREWETDREFLSLGAKRAEHTHRPKFDPRERMQEFTAAASSLLDSTYYWDWDTLTNAWIISSKALFTYDANSNQISRLYQNWNGSSWMNSSQAFYTYDANNDRTNRLHQSWNGSSWVDEWQEFSTYDANNNQTGWLRQSWNGVSWINIWQGFDTYDANNNGTSELYQTWDGSSWM